MSHLISIDILERIAVALEKLVEGPRLVGFDEKGQPIYYMSVKENDISTLEVK